MLAAVGAYTVNANLAVYLTHYRPWRRAQPYNPSTAANVTPSRVEAKVAQPTMFPRAAQYDYPPTSTQHRSERNVLFNHGGNLLKKHTTADPSTLVSRARQRMRNLELDRAILRSGSLNEADRQ